MAGYIGSKAVNLSTTGADINGDANIDGDLSFRDNDKAIFGAGSDLQIYHDGSNSWIKDEGTGVLAITTNGNGIGFYDPTGTEPMLFATKDNAVDLYFNGAKKLATTSTGIDVTGTVTADSLTVDTNTLHVDATNNRVGIGTSSPSSYASTTLQINGSSTSSDLKMTNTTTGTGNSAGFDLELNGSDINYVNRTASGTQKFWTNSTERMRINSSGNVGIGTSSPSANLEITQSGNNVGLLVAGGGYNYTAKFESSDAEANIIIEDSNSTNDGNMIGVATNDMYFITNASERMRIDSSGNVGIGTSSPSQLLTVGNTSTQYTRLQFYAATNGASTIHFGDGTSGVDNYQGYLNYAHDSNSMQFATNSSERMRIDSSGVVVINQPAGTSDSGTVRITGGASGSSNLQFADTYDGNIGMLQYNHTSNYLLFQVNNSEAMRIDSSGNLLVGKTAAGIANNGIELRANNDVLVTNDGNVALYLNRKSSDGDIVEFRKDGSTVGSIGANGGDIYVGNSDVTLSFNDVADLIAPTGTNGATRDGLIDLGNGGNRFDDIFATNGTIQTSDRNEKQDIAELTDAEQRVAVAAKGLLRKFRWRDAVEAKGDDARTHFGIIAQDLQAAFAAEGLDAGDYAMFISSTWTDEETGEERTRMGVRYSELLAFIIGAL